MPNEPKETTKPERLSDLGFTRTPSDDDPRRDPNLLAAVETIAPGTPIRQAVDVAAGRRGELASEIGPRGS